MENLYRVLQGLALLATLLAWLFLGLEAALYVIYGSFVPLGAVMLVHNLRIKRSLSAAGWALFALVGVLAILVHISQRPFP